MQIQEIKSRVEEGESLQLITRVFTEISSAKLKKIRKGIEQNRVFFYDLSNIYSLVNMLAAKQGVQKSQGHQKTAVILLTSNYRFYGQVTNPLIAYFLKNTDKQDVDRFIVGKTAHGYFDTINYQFPYKKITFSTDLPTMAEIQSLTAQVKDYPRVFVFYSQMKSVLVQTPVGKEITQSAALAQYENKESVSKLLMNFDYILEPELGIMLQFFDAQIKGLLLEQTFLESELSRTAARLISMDSAQNSAKDYVKDMKGELKTARKNIANSRIIETVSVLNLSRQKNQ